MMDRLSEIRARCETASKGPWKIGKESPSGAQNVGTLNGILTAQTTSKENAVFIAHAREDIPYLLAQLELSKAREHPVNLFPELTPQQRAENAEIVALTARAEKAEAERDAAIADIKRVDCREPGGMMCKNHEECYKWVHEHGGRYPECDGCDQWDWRGAKGE